MKWARLQRWSALVLIALIVANAHVALPLVASRVVSLLLLLSATLHVTCSLYVVLTDLRPFAARSGAVAAGVVVLGGLAALYGSVVILGAGGPAPILGHLDGADCARCHERVDHGRWPLSLHAGRGELPALGCEDCHRVSVATPHLLARVDREKQKLVGMATTMELCLDCHGPRWAAGPVWPGTIHESFKCGTCHSRIERAGEPSWKRACQKCHPRPEDVHADVKSLDTTYLSPASTNDVHTFKCGSCHAEMR